MKKSDCILVYGSPTKGDVVKRSDCILVYGSTTKGDVVKRSDCILVYGSITKGGVVKRSDCDNNILVDIFTSCKLIACLFSSKNSILILFQIPSLRYLVLSLSPYLGWVTEIIGV